MLSSPRTMPLLATGASLLERLRRALAAPSAAAWVVLIAILLVLPTLTVGLLGDDFLFRELLLNGNPRPHPGALFGLFTFADGVPEHTRQARDIGIFPWWVADNARMNFWRPLSELTHWLDFKLWPQSPVLMHAHSVAWYGLLVFLLGRFYRLVDANLLRANVSMLVFSVSTLHMLSVIWLAARNQLIAACFLLLCLSLHHVWRRQGQGAARWAAWLCFALGLLSAEAGIATLAYLVAYACFMDRGRTIADRAWSLLPYVLTVVLWRHQYDAWGYGSAGSGGYIDPGRDPLRFLEALALRLPSLLLAAVAGVSATTLQMFSPALKPVYALAAAGALLWMGCVTWRWGIWRSDALKFLAMGAVLSLVPVCAAETNDRLLLNAELGLSAVLGSMFVKALDVAGRRWCRDILGLRALLITLMGVHLLIFPLATLAVSVGMGRITAVASHDEPMSLPNVPAASGHHILLINPPKALFVGYYQAVRRYHGFENGAALQPLASGDQDLTLTVLDAHRLRIQASKGFGEEVTRDLRKLPMHPGERVKAGTFEVKVVSVKADGRADVVDFTFARRLDDPSLAFFVWTDSGYVPYRMPAADGSKVHFAPASLSKMFARRFHLGSS